MTAGKLQTCLEPAACAQRHCLHNIIDHEVYAHTVIIILIVLDEDSPYTFTRICHNISCLLLFVIMQPVTQ